MDGVPLVKLLAWSEEKTQGVLWTPNGHVVAKKGEVFFVAVVSQSEADRLIKTMTGDDLPRGDEQQ